MKKWFKAAGWLVLTPVMLCMTLAALLYLPPIQRWAVDKATAYAAEELGMQIGIERVRLSFPLDLELEGLRVQQSDMPLASLESLVVDLDLMRILLMQIRVEAVELRGLQLNTGELIEAVHIDGTVRRLLIKADNIDLKNSHVAFAQAELEGGDVHIALADSTESDSTESATIPWRIDLEQVKLDNVNLSFAMPADSLSVAAQIRQALLQQGEVNLRDGIYHAREFQLQTDTLRYGTDTDSLAHAGMDFAHIRLSHARLHIGNPYFNQHSGALSGYVGLYHVEERCGLRIDSLTAQLGMDSTALWADSLRLATPHSHIGALAKADLSTFSPTEKGDLRMQLEGQLGTEDLKYFIASMLSPKEMEALPKAGINLRLEADGNTDTLQLKQCRLEIPRILTASATGTLWGAKDWDNAKAKARTEVRTQNLSSVKKLLQLKGVELPAMRLIAQMEKNGPEYKGDLTLTEGKGKVKAAGRLHTGHMTYEAQVRAEDLQLDHFLPNDSMFALTAQAAMKGRGTDMLSPHTLLNAKAQLEQFTYKHWEINNIGLTANLNRGTGAADFWSDNALLKMHARAEVKMNRKISLATFMLKLNHIDLYALNLSRDTLAASMVMNLEGTTDFGKNHRLEGSVQNMELKVKEQTYHPLDLQMKLLMEADSIYVHAGAGDLLLSVNSSNGLDDVMKRIDTFSRELERQRKTYYIDQDTLRTMLPQLTLYLHSGKRNPMHNILQHMTGYTYNDLLLEVDADPGVGLRGGGHVHGMHTGKLPVDTIQWRIYQDSTGVNMRGKISNNRKNRIATFESNWFADITPTGVEAGLEYLDAQKRKGIDIGMKADALEEGFRLSLTPANPIIAYRRFTLNPDNFMSLNRNGRVEALVDLLADDGTGLKLYSTPNEDALQDISMELNHVNLGELSSVLPYMPRLDGLLQGDVHYLQSDSSLSVSADTYVQDFKFENSPIGNIGVNAVYLPNADGTHHLDGMVTHNDEDALRLIGEYHSKDGVDSIQAEATLMRLPLQLANGFIPDHLVELNGFAKGKLLINGTPDNPILNGAFLTESLFLKSTPYSLNMTFADDTIHIRQNVVDLDRIRAYAIGNNPMVMDGNIDLQDMDAIRVNLAVSAKNYQLINASKTKSAQAYGKVYVDIGAMLRGTLNDLKLRGRLTVLGNTDVTYVLKDSPISAENQLSDLVEFVDMSDTIAQKQNVQLASPQKMDMLFTVNIESAAQVHCLLSEDGSDYVNLEGGGELTLSYNSQNDIQLNGRYTILEGDMKYSLMELVSKHFNITPNSYVEFHGNMMNPTLYIQATERVKSTVTENNMPRSVAFDVGLKLSQTLNRMGLEFTLDAPEDMSIQNELAAMSAEQRGRVAVTMLATGIYLTDNYKASGMSSSNALYNYLQSQVNAIAGKALQTVDVNFDIDNTINQTGGTQTDYNFSFAKRFWGNRVRLIIGGKVSSGDNVVNNGQTIIDNVSLEYRLDNSATRYIKLYYDKNYESLLEGELTEMGAGAVFRRKSAKLGDLFIFRRKKK